MNALRLYHDLKKRGVMLEADGVSLKVDAPAGALTDEDKAALVEHKAALLRFLSRARASQEPEDDGRRFDARPSRHPGYTSLYDPAEGVWHDFPTQDCFLVHHGTHEQAHEGRRGVIGDGGYPIARTPYAPPAHGGPLFFGTASPITPRPVKGTRR
jgi:hypothetical protein